MPRIATKLLAARRPHLFSFVTGIDLRTPIYVESLEVEGGSAGLIFDYLHLNLPKRDVYFAVNGC